MFLRIESLPEKKLVGMSRKMSFLINKTVELWQNFMQQRSKIENRIGLDFYSVQVYHDGYWTKFDPAAEFEKWATVEVDNYEHIPEGMQAFAIPMGFYAVFLHKGPASEGDSTFRYIFQTWLPNSDYILDNRPHFEILGVKYKNESPDSEEEIWIPVRVK